MLKEKVATTVAKVVLLCENETAQDRRGIGGS